MNIVIMIHVLVQPRMFWFGTPLVNNNKTCLSMHGVRMLISMIFDVFSEMKHFHENKREIFVD